MSWGSSNTQAMPVSWEGLVDFKLMKPGERIGYVNTMPPKTAFKLVSAGLEPLVAFAPRMPFECQNVKDIHAANKLTLMVQMDKRLWTSLNDLDTQFDKFLMENAAKIFGPAECDFLRKNPSALALKRAKRLAPFDPAGNPIYDARLSLRVSGRTMEVESVQTTDGQRGAYVTSVTWGPRTEALPQSATRFSKVTGHTTSDFNGNSMPIVRDTMPIFALGDVFKAGSSHVRYVGPGDMAQKCLIHHALIRPAYWTNVGGGFMITVSLDHVIFENIMSEPGHGVASERSGAPALPDGFARDPQELGKPAEASHPLQPQVKRRLVPSSVAAAGGGAMTAEEWDAELAHGMPASRGLTGGAAETSSVGASGFRAMTRSATGAAGAFDEAAEREEDE